MSRRVLVIGAHSADFVWRAGGAVAVATRNGGTAQVIALSYGERGESGELWKQPDQTIERVKRVRHEEAEKAAAALGAEFKALDFGDYPLEVGPERFTQVVDAIREFAPDVLITHTDTDPFNPDLERVVAEVERLEFGAERRGGLLGFFVADLLDALDRLAGLPPELARLAALAVGECDDLGGAAAARRDRDRAARAPHEVGGVGADHQHAPRHRPASACCRRPWCGPPRR